LNIQNKHLILLKLTKMLVITTFKIENEFSNLENNMKKLKLLDNSMIFQKIITESMELLSRIPKNSKW
jgi:hypothetical protein